MAETLFLGKKIFEVQSFFCLFVCLLALCHIHLQGVNRDLYCSQPPEGYDQNVLAYFFRMCVAHLVYNNFSTQ